ncbi:hypothetical protein PWT90_06581 [Aphanocladium album]|nr:hypothetical protein PWT90_06581 [Aphanocladium album]
MSRTLTDAEIEEKVDFSEIRGIAISTCISLVIVVCFEFGNTGQGGPATLMLCIALRVDLEAGIANTWAA